MSKENGDLYFPHDFNSANDEKTVAFLSSSGAEGYGVFWLIVEQMHKNDGVYEKKDYNYRATAHRSLTTVERIKAILNDLINCELFYEDSDGYYSERVIKNLEHSKKISIQNAENARKRKVKTSDRSATASDRSATADIQDKIRQDKIKEEKKNNKKEIPPLPSENELREIFFSELKKKCEKLNLNYPEDIDKLKADEKCLVYIEYCKKYYGTKKQYKDYNGAARTFLNEVSKLRNYKKPESEQLSFANLDDVISKICQNTQNCKPGNIYNYIKHKDQVGMFENWTFEQIYRHGCKVALFSENQWQKEKKPVKVNIEGKKEIDKFLEGV